MSPSHRDAYLFELVSHRAWDPIVEGKYNVRVAVLHRLLPTGLKEILCLSYHAFIPVLATTLPDVMQRLCLASDGFHPSVSAVRHHIDH